MSSDLVATKVLNVLLRKQNPGIPSIPPSDPLPAEAGLTTAVAAETLDTIGKLAKTGTPAAGAPSPAQLNVVTQLSRSLPWPPPGDPLQAVVTQANLANARNVIRQLSGQVKAKANLK